MELLYFMKLANVKKTDPQQSISNGIEGTKMEAHGTFFSFAKTIFKKDKTINY
jgi:hypothetical protein